MKFKAGFGKLAVVFIALAAIQASAHTVSGKKTNIILIMTDDMGIECLGTYGGTTYKTPNLDRLAAEGMQFQHCYSQPLCTPSRVKIMTGRYNFRNYTKFKHLDPSQTTFGHVAKSAGYTTAVAGKWQLDGSAKDDFATKFGFDRYCVWYLNQKNFGSRFLHPKLVQDGKQVGGQGLYGPDVVNNFALNFVETNKDQPFFLYYPMILPHFPFEPTPDSPEWDPTAKKSPKDKRFFVDMVEYMDKLIGKLVAKIDELGLSENTLIMFTSDNGTYRSLVSEWNGQEYVGGKGYLNNTGTHVPLLIKWPSMIKRGQTRDELIDFSDFFATIQELTGGEGPTDYKIDGHSFLPLLQGDPNFEPRSFTFCHYNPLWGTPETGNWVRNRNYKVYGEGSAYKLTNDYFEKNPLTNIEGNDVEQIQPLVAQLKKFQSEGSEPPFQMNRTPEQKAANEAAKKAKKKK